MDSNSPATLLPTGQASYLTVNPSQTRKLGEILAKEVLKTKPLREKAFVFGLEGGLGGGKTTFIQGFAKGLGIKNKILSPTFVIIKKFPISNKRARLDPRRGREGRGRGVVQFSNFYHIDCYRIKKPKEVLALGFKEVISNPKNIVAIEWADHIRKILPKDALKLKFEFINQNKRKIKTSYY